MPDIYLTPKPDFAFTPNDVKLGDAANNPSLPSNGPAPTISTMQMPIFVRRAMIPG